MRAAQMLAEGEVKCVDAAVPELDAEPGVVVRTRVATVCGSDLHNVFAGTSLETLPCRPGYPGHESTGEVVASNMPGVVLGDAILAVPDLSCSAAFAEYQHVPARFVVPIPAEKDRREIVLAQQLGTVIWAMKRYWPAGMRDRSTSSTATVTGAGTAGIFFIRLLRWLGFAHVIVSEPIAERRRLALEAGADIAVDSAGEEIVRVTEDATDGVGADLVIEASGEDSARVQAVEAVRLDGRVGFFGTPSSLGLAPFPFNTFFRKRATLETSHSAQHEENLASFRQAVDLIGDGRFDPSGIITDSFSIEQIDTALERAHHPSGGSMKIAIDFGRS